MTRYFVWAGGRKTGLGLLGAAILIVMAFVLGATFEAFAGALLLCLGITQGTVAWEDSRRPEWAQAGAAAPHSPEAATWNDVKWPEGRIVDMHKTGEEGHREELERQARRELERRARRPY